MPTNWPCSLFSKLPANRELDRRRCIPSRTQAGLLVEGREPVMRVGYILACEGNSPAIARSRPGELEIEQGVRRFPYLAARVPEKMRRIGYIFGQGQLALCETNSLGRACIRGDVWRSDERAPARVLTRFLERKSVRDRTGSKERTISGMTVKFMIT